LTCIDSSTYLVSELYSLYAFERSEYPKIIHLGEEKGCGCQIKEIQIKLWVLYPINEEMDNVGNNDC